MRIIAGKFGSRRLIAPKGAHTRPTLERTRESLFSMLGPLLGDASVLDLFAGSGALGLEALSRGAAYAAFCDCDRDAARAVRANIQALGVEGQSALLVADYRKVLTHLDKEGRCFDLVFVDPPYDMPAEPVLGALVAHSLITSDSVIVLEQDRRNDVELPSTLRVWKSRTYADTRIDILTCLQEEAHAHSGFPGQL